MRFTIVALAIAAAPSPLAWAEPSQAYSQCVAFARQDKLAEAEPFCVQAATEPGKEGKVLHGDFLSRKGDVDGAIKRYNEVLEGADPAKFTPAEFTALKNRALVGFYSGRPAADADARAVLKLAPNDVDVLRAAAQYAATGKLEYVDRLIALDPKSAEYQVWRSYISSSQREYDEALVAAEAALKLQPGSPFALTARGYAHGASGEYAKAEKDHAAVTRKVPNEPDPWINRAEMLYQLKRYDDAVESASQGLSLRPGDARALGVRGNAHLAMGNADAALADGQGIQGSQEYVWIASQIQETAEIMRDAQRAMTPQAVASLEADRAIVLGAIGAEMHQACGYFTVPSAIQDEPDNDALHAYADCLDRWRDTEYDEQSARSIGQDAIAAGERLGRAESDVDEAEQFLCSNMPKKAKCIDDALHARAIAALDISGNPKEILRSAEVDRLNRDIASYNAMVSRFNATSKAASFLQGVANALSAQ